MEKYFEDIGFRAEEKHEEAPKEEGEEEVPEFGKTTGGGIFHNFSAISKGERYKTIEEALRITNDSPFGLQAGIFTQSIDHALEAWNELEVGGIILNDTPTYRIDPMPYGGVKDSGLGREGIRYALEEMTEIRLLVINSRAH